MFFFAVSQKIDCFTETLPTGDIYLHEFLGSFLWDEGFLDFINNLKSQSITNIFPENITIFSGTKDFKFVFGRVPYDYSNLSSDVKNFLTIPTGFDKNKFYFNKNIEF